MKTVLITGAAGGVGQAVARRFTAGGWQVIGTDLVAAVGVDFVADLTEVELPTAAGGGCKNFDVVESEAKTPVVLQI